MSRGRGIVGGGSSPLQRAMNGTNGMMKGVTQFSLHMMRGNITTTGHVCSRKSTSGSIRRGA